MNTLTPAFFSEVTRLYRAAMGTQKGVLVITSVQPGDGASLTAHLLAQRSAEEGKPVLLVDFNLRNTVLTERVGLMPRDWDLDPADTKLAKLEEILTLVKEVRPGLFALPAPADAPSVQWLSEESHAEKFFKVLAKAYPQVIVDTTPLTVANRNNIEPSVLASVASRVVLVVATGVTSKDKLKHAVQDLAMASANLVGVVVNDRAHRPALAVLEGWARALSYISPGLSLWIKGRVREARSQ